MHLASMKHSGIIHEMRSFGRVWQKPDPFCGNAGRVVNLWCKFTRGVVGGKTQNASED